MARFPAEIWAHIFSFLSTSDKLNVRASCQLFRRLLDRGCLWKDWAVTLRFKSCRYNSKFWVSLRRRRLSSVVVRSVKEKDWRLLAVCLPDVTTVVMEQSCQSCIRHLKDLQRLRRLSLRSSQDQRSPGLQSLPVSQLHCLTHLSMCGVTFPFKSRVEFQSAFSEFSHLTWLSNHCTGMHIFKDAVSMIHSTVACLPKLEHLSLCLSSVSGPSNTTWEPQGSKTLTSLELINCSDVALTDDTMRTLPGLRSLTIIYSRCDLEMQSVPRCHLKTWLCDLPHLSSLVVVNGPPVQNYVAFIPASVTTLGLYAHGLSTALMKAVAFQVPNLLHLHMVLWPSVSRVHSTDLSVLFPKLRSLKILHIHLQEKLFLKLSELNSLEHVEVLDDHPDHPKLIGKLKSLTQNRLRITTYHSSPRDVFLCSCSEKVEQFV